MTKNSQAKKPRFIGYCRVSTHHQEDKISLEAQPDELQRYCELRGFELVKILSEIESAYKLPIEERPKGREALELIHQGKADGIIVTKLNRAFRSTKDALNTVDRITQEGGISFVCIDFLNGEPLEVINGSPMARLIFTIFAGLAEFERGMTAARTAAALRYKQSRGEWVGRIPYGFRIEGGRLVEDAEKIKNIIAMKRAYRRGKKLRAIGRDYGMSHSTISKLVKTDLRLLRKRALGKTPDEGYEEERKE